MPQPVIELVGYGLLLSPLVLSLVSLWVLLKHPEPKAYQQRLAWFSAGVSLLLLLFSGSLMIAADTGHWDLDHPYEWPLFGIHIDALSLWFILLASLIAFAAALNFAGHATDTKRKADDLLRHPAFFQMSLNGFLFAMLLVPILDNLIGLWIGIELTTLASALVIGYRNSPDAWEAAWKYLIVTSAGIVLALIGTMFLAYAIPDELVTGSPQNSLLNWTELMEMAKDQRLDDRFVTLAFLFALVGYGTRAGLAPMHTWVPDAHGEAPAQVSALLSGVLLKLALYAILRFYTITNAALGNSTFTSSLMLAAGLLSLLLATPFILKRNRFKRVLAYHSVEHMGIICVGIGIGTPLALAGALLHTLNHAVTKGLMFLAYGNINRAYRSVLGWTPESGDRDEKITNVVRTMPITATLLALGGLALIGTPPFGIFFSELMILWGAMERLFWDPADGPLPSGLPDWAVVIGIVLFMLTTTLIFYGLVRHLSDHLLKEPPPKSPGSSAAAGGIDDVERFKKQINEHDPRRLLFDLVPLLLLAVCMLGLVFFPPIIDLLHRCVAILTPAH